MRHAPAQMSTAAWGRKIQISLGAQSLRLLARSIAHSLTTTTRMRRFSMQAPWTFRSPLRLRKCHRLSARWQQGARAVEHGVRVNSERHVEARAHNPSPCFPELLSLTAGNVAPVTEFPSLCP